MREKITSLYIITSILAILVAASLFYQFSGEKITGLTVSEDDIVYFYKFEDNLEDETETSKPQKFGGEFIDGKIGRALRFRGGEYVRTFERYFDKHDDLSLSLWLMPEGTTLRHQMIIWQGDEGSGGYEATDEAILSLNPDGDVLTFRMMGFPNDLMVNSAVSKDVWSSVVVTVRNLDTSSPTANLYLNGVLVSSNTTDNGVPRNQTATMNIAKPGANRMYFKGSIDELIFYNKAITEEEISGIFQEGVKCSSDIDCGGNSTETYCIGNESCTNHTTVICVNPGLPSSFCSNQSEIICEDCPHGCENGSCLEFNGTALGGGFNLNPSKDDDPDILNRGQAGFFKKVWCWLINPSDKSGYQSCLSD